MKTFRFFGMALFAVLMCVNFASCSSSDDDEPEVDNESGVVTNGKKLIEMKMDEEREQITWTFSYDDKNRLTAIKEVEIDTEFDYQYTSTCNLTWGDGIIFHKNDRRNIIFTFSNGLITSAESEDGDLSDATFTYNSSKQLITFKDEQDYDIYISNYTWENGKLIKITDEDAYVTQISYNNKTCKGYFPFMALMGDDTVFFAAHPELIGMRTNQLPSKAYAKWEDEEETTEFSYTFTNDGYVESCTVKVTEMYNGEEDVDITIWTFKWQ